MTIDEILRPEDVKLSLRSQDKAGAVDEVLTQLRGDERVKNWEVLREAIIERDAPALDDEGVGLCIAHARTPSVGSLVVAAGRSTDGVACPEVSASVKLFFVAGVPSTVDSEYLRLVGAIVRVCRNPKEFAKLLSAEDGDSFVEILTVASERLV